MDRFQVRLDAHASRPGDVPSSEPFPASLHWASVDRYLRVCENAELRASLREVLIERNIPKELMWLWLAPLADASLVGFRL